MKTIYIGRKTSFKGKTVWEILANLKNFGIGRMITRHELTQYPEPSYHIIRRVEPRMDEELRFGTVYCETVFRGKRLPGIRSFKDGYNPDFRLIPKDEEQKFLNGYQVTDLGDVKTLLPKNYSVPPLMKLFLMRHKQEKGQTVDIKEEFKIPFVYLNEKDLNTEKDELFWLKHRIAEEGEDPDIKFEGKFTFYDRYTKELETDVQNN
ncbi:uncharacterized protein LOC128965551 [Oppia nitens]|uniref:uncharacterized protein LOC128965551 n=1 Tax=Oppia nitens TaxID=1686743 RepID=UPI0023DB2497|nr:uncharacterized protein LOC128965551 [Oppia nitens]